MINFSFAFIAGMKPVNTRKLVLRLIKSDVKAYNELFLEYYEKVFNFCLKFLHQKEDAEEVAQEVFIVVWQNRKKIDSSSSFSSYLFGIAKNKIYNLYRKSFHAESYINYVLMSDENFDYVTESDVIFNELNEIYENLVEQLPEKRREVFRLSRKKGLSYKEIAKELNISENTVDVQIRKALDFLRQEIKKLYN